MIVKVVVKQSFSMRQAYCPYSSKHTIRYGQKAEIKFFSEIALLLPGSAQIGIPRQLIRKRRQCESKTRAFLIHLIASQNISYVKATELY